LRLALLALQPTARHVGSLQKLWSFWHRDASVYGVLSR
jgi:hypothetical protein